MNDGWVWAPQVGPLSRVGAVHIVRTDGLDDLGAMARRLLEETAGPLLIAGHSMGGRVALEAAVTAPERVVGLALLSTGAHGAAPAEAAGRERLVHLARDAGMATVAEAWLPPMIGPACPAETRAAITAMLCRCSPETFAGQQRALIARPDRLGALARLACPTLVATGALDGWASPAQHEALAAAIPGARLAIVPGAGHMLPVEAPEATAALLRAWADGLG